MWHFIQHIQPEEPAIGDIYLNLFYRLAHAFNAIKILDERNLDQHDGVHTGASVVLTVFIFYQFINEGPVDCFVDDPQQMVLWNHVIHAKQLNLFSFFIRILCHHKHLTACI